VYVDSVTRVLADWRFWVALVGTAVAFAVATIVTVTAARSWRAEIAIVVGTGAGPLRPGERGATRELADRLDDLVRSDQIAANVISGLHLRESRSSLLERISVAAPEAGLLRVRVTDRSRLRAPQIAQEIGFLFPQLVEHRFPRLNAVVWDPAHLVGRTGRHWGRNFGIAGGVAAALWAVVLAAMLQRWRPVRAAPPPVPPVAPPAPVGPEPRLQPEPAPPLEAEPAPPPLPSPARSQPSPSPQPQPASPSSEPTPHPAATEPVAAEPGAWKFADLERLVREHRANFPDRAEEWDIYLESMRAYAAPDGHLPASLDWLVWDTFGDVLERSDRT
jgi:capsular polysaccharide biosynthesis protein